MLRPTLTFRILPILNAAVLLTIVVCVRPLEEQFTVSASIGQAHFEVLFTTNLSVKADKTFYLWDFGDGGTDNYPVTTSHTYTEAGVFVVQLTVILEKQSELAPETRTFFQTITVEPGPLARVMVQPTDVTLTPTNTQSFTAKALDQFDNPIPGLTFIWSVETGDGTINVDGVFTPGVVGTSTVKAKATQGSITRFTIVSVAVGQGSPP